jgi:hypothetical protein
MKARTPARLWRMAALTCAMLAGGFTGPATAATPEQYAALCERAIINGARRGGVPEPVLRAISLTETGRQIGGALRPWPWAANVEGKGYWFDNRAEAVAFIKSQMQQGKRSIDMGCFQINYRWHGHAFPSVEAMFDPEYAATYAAQFLRNLYAEHGSWPRAAGAYHSLTPHYANIYRARFERILAGVGGEVLNPGEIQLAAAGADMDVPAEPEKPRDTRTRMQRGPLIISLPRDPAAGPPPEPVMGSVAAVAGAAPSSVLFHSGSAPLLTQGAPLFVEGQGPLFGDGTEVAGGEPLSAQLAAELLF